MLNRREAIAAAIGAAGAAVLPAAKEPGLTCHIRNHWGNWGSYCYADVTNLWIDVRNSTESKMERFFLRLNGGSDIEVSEETFDHFIWLNQNKMYMGNQFFTGMLSNAAQSRIV